MLIMRGPGAFAGGKVIDQPVTHLDVYPTLCEVAEVEPPDWLQGESLIPLLRGEVDVLHEATFAEMTYHAAYEPQRSVRTERWKYIRRFDDFPGPVLANCDDSASKEIWLEAGWGERTVAREQLYDLVLDPAEMDNLAADPSCAEALAEMRGRLDDWMRETDDPLLDGPVDAAAGRRGQRAVAGLARRADPDRHGRSHGRSIQVRQVQPTAAGAPPGSRTSPSLKVVRAQLEEREVPHPLPPVLGEGVAEDRVEQEEAGEDAVGDEQRQRRPGLAASASKPRLQQVDALDRLGEGPRRGGTRRRRGSAPARRPSAAPTASAVSVARRIGLVRGG